MNHLKKSHHCARCHKGNTVMLILKKLTGQRYSLCEACAKATGRKAA